MDYNTQRLFVSNFIDNIVNIRASTGKSQDEVSKILGITRQTLSTLENDKGDYKFTNVLSLAALFDYYAKEDISIKTAIDDLNFYIMESDYLDCIFKSYDHHPETLSEAWIQKRVLYEVNDFRSILFDFKDLEKYCLYIDLISFCDGYIRDAGERLLQLCMRLKELERIAPQELYLDKTLRERETLSDDIIKFVKQLNICKADKIIEVYPVRAQYDSYDDLIKNAKFSKPCLVISSDINKLDQCRSTIPLLITRSGLLIRVDRLNADQIKNLKTNYSQIDEDISPLSVLEELFDL